MSSSADRPETDRVALVTGGAIRVGAAMVEALHAAGYRVWIHCRQSQAAADQLRGRLADPDRLAIATADLTNRGQRAELCQQVLDAAGPFAGRLDLLVNSAASFESGAFSERSDDDLKRVLELNLVAPLSLARSFRAALARQKHASIVNIVDLGAHYPWRDRADHCIAKSGLAMATRALALEWAPGIRVNAIAPGTVLWPEGSKFAADSPIRQAAAERIPMGDRGRPEDVAQALLYLAEAPFVTGQILSVDGGRSSEVGE